MPALLWGVAFANIVRGVPIDADKEYTGSLFDLLNPFALLGGLVTLTLFVTHGAMFLALKTDRRHPAPGPRPAPGGSACVAAVLAVVLPGLDPGRSTGDVGSVGRAVRGRRAAARWSAVAAAYGGREGWAFAGTFGGDRARRGGLFAGAVPRRDAVARRTRRLSLTTTNASATPYTLKIMTWVAVIFTPLVLLYQGWTYWVFRKRIGTHHIPTAELASR